MIAAHRQILLAIGVTAAQGFPGLHPVPVPHPRVPHVPTGHAGSPSKRTGLEIPSLRRPPLTPMMTALRARPAHKQGVRLELKPVRKQRVASAAAPESLDPARIIADWKRANARGGGPKARARTASLLNEMHENIKLGAPSYVFALVAGDGADIQGIGTVSVFYLVDGAGARRELVDLGGFVARPAAAPAGDAGSRELAVKLEYTRKVIDFFMSDDHAATGGLASSSPPVLVVSPDEAEEEPYEGLGFRLSELSWPNLVYSGPGPGAPASGGSRLLALDYEATHSPLEIRLGGGDAEFGADAGFGTYV